MLLGGFRLEAHLEVPDQGAEGVISRSATGTTGGPATSSTVVPFSFSILDRADPPRRARPAARRPRRAVRRVPDGAAARRRANDRASMTPSSPRACSPTIFRSVGRSAVRDCWSGRDRGLPVTDDYEPPFPCTARIPASRRARGAIRTAPRHGHRARRHAASRVVDGRGAPRLRSRREWDLNPRCP